MTFDNVAEMNHIQCGRFITKNTNTTAPDNTANGNLTDAVESTLRFTLESNLMGSTIVCRVNGQLAEPSVNVTLSK